ncbi:hypothetical protein CC80DRAFT_496665 [Byssothecium circinans]|uniref:Uncharacterized protein n=1 Tax=Byssothecium circinans TaxID=147558 RepID=A0A6A5TG08_9PLEO|nr:hypothetical protein CC80DRAFT_496665 [Byssothecium circinans]
MKTTILAALTSLIALGAASPAPQPPAPTLIFYCFVEPAGSTVQASGSYHAFYCEKGKSVKELAGNYTFYDGINCGDEAYKCPV